MLHQDQKEYINKAILSFEKTYGVQMAIVLLNELPADMSIEDYAREIGRKWGVGTARNGLVYVAAIGQRKQRLEVSEHLEGVIPDITARHLTDGIKPYFRSQKYGEGIYYLLAELDPLIKQYHEEKTKPPVVNKSDSGMDGSTKMLIIICFLVGIPGIVLLWIHLYNKRTARRLKEQQDKKREYENNVAEAARIRARAEELERYQNRLDRKKYSPADTAETKPKTKPRETYQPPEEVYTPPAVIVIPEEKKDEDRSNNYSSGYGSGSDSSSSSSSSSSDYGNWGSSDSGSSSSSSSDSGFTGGGSSNDW